MITGFTVRIDELSDGTCGISEEVVDCVKEAALAVFWEGLRQYLLFGQLQK